MTDNSSDIPPSLLHIADALDIRTAEIDGQTWFALADVCRALGIYNYASSRTPNTTRAASWLESGDTTREEIAGQRGVPAIVISESALYKLILRTDRNNPLARAFQDWIFSEVLPGVRMEGDCFERSEG